MIALSKARYALAAIRIINGLLALVAPSLIIKRFGEDPDKDAAAIYGLRLFGVRTVLIGADLITEHGQPLEHTISQAVIIHASDTVTAATLGTSGRLRPAMAVPITLDLGAQYRARHRRMGLQPPRGDSRDRSPDPNPAASYDYIVVGSGAGGGPLAARLAETGMRVLLLEAGEQGASGPDSDDYAVPAFHGRATEDPATSWQFFVRHYADRKQAERDEKYVAARDGVFYPRAAALGGCTAHNAMITVYPHAQDWDGIAALTGDQSWAAANMRPYFERLEDCGYWPRPWQPPANPAARRPCSTHLPLVSERFKNEARHGFGGWLGTSLADPELAVADDEIRGILLDAVGQAPGGVPRAGRSNRSKAWAAGSIPTTGASATIPEGLWQIPLAVRGGHRNGSRERIRDVAQRFPDRLQVRTGCLATRVLLDEQPAATGVEYIDAAHAYWCDPSLRAAPMPPRQQAYASREVVLAGGAFNTPQLLKLSGIGPREELERFGIPVRLELPGVGRNLQDRYEVGVVSRMTRDFSLLRGDRFRPPGPGEQPDPAFREWQCGPGHLRDQRRAGGGSSGVPVARLPAPTCSYSALPARVRGLLPGLLGRAGTAPRLLHLGRAQGAHHQPGGRGPAPLRRPARAAATSTSTTSTKAPTPRAPISTRWWTACRSPRDVMSRAGDLVAGRDLAGSVRADPRRATGLGTRPGLGPPRVVHLPHRAGQRPGGGGRQPLPGARSRTAAHRGRVGFPAHSRVLHRHLRLHAGREGERRHPRRRPS